MNDASSQRTSWTSTQTDEKWAWRNTCSNIVKEASGDVAAAAAVAVATEPSTDLHRIARALARAGLVVCFVLSQCVAAGAAAAPEPTVEESTDDEPVDDEPARPNVSGDAEARESVYVDSDHTTISTTSADVTFSPGDTGLTFRGGYLADVVSSASVDVISAATGRFEELRNQGSGGVGLERGQWQADLGYVFSDENDWTSHTGSAGLGRDFFQRNTNITAGYVFVHNQVFRADDDGFRDRMLTHAGNVALTQVLGKKTNFRMTGFVGHNAGFQSSPYRYVPVGTTPGAEPDPAGTCVGAEQCPLERHPRRRLRTAVNATLLHYVGRKQPASIRVDYRVYGDTWEVVSHTATLAYTTDLAKHWQFRARSRTYFQDAAYFYRERYAQPLRYVSVDRELSMFIHQLTGVKFTFKSGLLHRFDDIRVDLKADMFYFHFFNYVRLPSRIGGIVELGLRLVF
jgi:hypothetical protein